MSVKLVTDESNSKSESSKSIVKFKEGEEQKSEALAVFES
jgi:hypothetical protein